MTTEQVQLGNTVGGGWNKDYVTCEIYPVKKFRTQGPAGPLCRAWEIVAIRPASGMCSQRCYFGLKNAKGEIQAIVFVDLEAAATEPAMYDSVHGQIGEAVRTVNDGIQHLMGIPGKQYERELEENVRENKFRETFAGAIG